ncbi:MAG TPA: tRNA-binding protein [Candidatus Heimdallarchaeota archaeon]|nr:tRNA-binding protein [Candidatus Heimdallarchaeota archaeon]
MKPAPVKPNVVIEDLEKLDIRVGTIESVDDVPGSKKLVKLVVDFGDHARTILAGIKQERDPSEIRGRQALFVVNLAPRKMAGEVSEGMLFDLGYLDGITPVLAVPERRVPNGVRAG